jgi:hypothetical protein
MANYFVSSSGSNTSPYDTWAKAATSLQTALTAATAAGDVIALDVAGVPSGDAENAGTTTYTFGGSVALIASTNSGASTITPTAMSTTSWVGNSTTARNLNVVGAHKVYVFGLTFSMSGSSTATHSFNTSDGGCFVFDTCRFFFNSTSAGTAQHQFGGVANCYTKTVNCVIDSDRPTPSGSLVAHGGIVEHVNLIFEQTAANKAGFLGDLNITVGTANACSVTFNGGDLSTCNATLVDSCGRAASEFRFINVKLPASHVMLATQTPANPSSANVWVRDCSSGDTHGLFGYGNAFGTAVSDTGIYFTSGAAGQSWKIVTTANCSYYTPFELPWFGYYNTVTTSITPYVEILRDGSTTAYQDDEVWLDVMAKTTSGSTQATQTTDRMTLLGTPANHAAGAGLGSWTGESGTAWSGKLVSPSITPAEVGHIQARIVVGEPSITVYADPQIRT